MRKFISIAVATVMMLAMSLVLTGCGDEPANLEEYMEANPSVQEELTESMSELEDETLSLDVYFEGNCMVMSLKYKDTYSAEEVEIMKPSFDGFSDYFQTIADDTIKNIEEATELEDITIKIEFLNGNGDEIWVEEFSMQQ